MVVLVLVLLWVVVLTPRVVRRFREGSSQSSIESFHEQLHLLERTGPKLVQPAYRLEDPDARTSPGSFSLVESSGAAHATPRLVHGIRKKQAAWERRRSRRRRRDVLLGLLGLATLTGGLGALHALHLLWAITGISAFAIAGYVALVAYAQLLHADRDAARPVCPPLGATAAPSSSRARPGRARPAATPAMMDLDVEGPPARRPFAARAGYPGAWDEELAIAAPRAASGG